MPHYSTRNSSKNQHNAPQTSPACPLPYDAGGFVLDEFVKKKFERDKDESRTENEIQALKRFSNVQCNFLLILDLVGKEKDNRRTPIASCVLGYSNRNIPPALPLPCGYCAISTAMVINDGEEDGGDEIM
jgi:hypothetical protein